MNKDNNNDWIELEEQIDKNLEARLIERIDEEIFKMLNELIENQYNSIDI